MKSTNFNYQSLSPERILDALASLMIYPETGLLELNSYENRVYKFTDEKKITYIVKFYRSERWSLEQIAEEHKFIQELALNDCFVAPPIKIEGNTLHFLKGYHFALFQNIPARAFEIDNIDKLYDIGIELGKIHKIAKQGEFKFRDRLTVTNMISKPIEELKLSEYIPKYLQKELLQTMEHLKLLVSTALDAAKFDEFRLHGDLHPSNILINDNVHFVDFDDVKTGPAVQDFWMLLHGSTQDKQLQLSMLLDGYQESLSFNLAELNLIEPLRSMRMIHYVSWINKRWCDPAFKRNFPWFITDQYWKELLQSLKQQITAMEETPLALQPYFESL